MSKIDGGLPDIKYLPLPITIAPHKGFALYGNALRPSL